MSADDNSRIPPRSPPENVQPSAPPVTGQDASEQKTKFFSVANIAGLVALIAIYWFLKVSEPGRAFKAWFWSVFPFSLP